jgi:hypothetical protein
VEPVVDKQINAGVVFSIDASNSVPRSSQRKALAVGDDLVAAEGLLELRCREFLAVRELLVELADAGAGAAALALVLQLCERAARYYPQSASQKVRESESW